MEYFHKIAKVIPLYKKGLKTMLDNYRPNSILPAISKAFENILYDQLYGYLSNSGCMQCSLSRVTQLHLKDA